MLGPVQARGHQLDRGRVHGVNGALETVEQALALAAAGKARVETLEVIEDGPEELLGQRGVAVFVGVGQIVAAGRGGAPQSRERTRVQAQGITDVVEPDGVGQLRVEQRDDVAPRRERAGFLIDPRRAGQLGDEEDRDVVADLAEDRILVRRWRRGSWFIHPAVWRRIRPVPTLFCIRLWDGCD